MRSIPVLKFFSSLLVCSLIFFTGVQSCHTTNTYKKKVFYINSYHRGFPPSDEITEGVLESLPADSFNVITFFMDTKRNPSEAYKIHRAAELLDSIRIGKPDVLIVSDDNALKYLVAPNFKGDPLPIVFCGVNWSADQYELSGYNITGVLEILPVADLVNTLKPYFPGMRNFLVLNENTTTSRKTKPLLDTLLGNLGMEVSQELVDDFDAWTSVFIEANQTFDIIYLQTRGAIKNWDHEKALEVITQHTQIPLVTCEAFMMPYAVFGLTQISKEQGMLAADMAKKILSGADPSDIPITKNTMSKVWINPKLAETIGFQPEEILMSRAMLLE